MEQTTEEYDKDKARAFTQTMLGIMNGGALSLMMSIGHKTGLFDAMDGATPATSAEIAERSGLSERYVREWLSAMACGGIIDYDVAAQTFQLPAEHAGLLTRRSGPLNLTVPMQQVALLGEVEADIVEAFHSGGGVPYDKFPRFQALMSEQSGNRFDRTLIDHIVPLLGIQEQLDQGIDVADVGCGSGRALSILGSAFPNSRFVGFDVSEDGIAAAQQNSAGLSNVSFQVCDAAQLDPVEQFDVVTTFDAIHDQAHPMDVLLGVHRMLRSTGTYLCVEPKASSLLEENIADPMAPFMYTVSTMHCMTVSLAYDGEGLGTAWGHQTATEYLTDAGFTNIEITGVRDDRSNNYFISKKP
ncbi:MAG: class I SAM-dependent methyltransferase [Actinomycetota bacterium]|nr:class I SAM-dependent methyltransferase [Actinomycetota bacterium]